ncbi:LysR family transcriptional regulator [Mycolicibacterium cosmeticum]|uniref:Probable hydrogen peroxide-inducible genes activator n=2 Tax=Mycolicibacterium cosmeticum TaxID=258533 RepID=W9AXG8_MYCCO|nr:LysR family transcriptional regulator [Mycolicibacterium cosmeticum]
MDLELRLIRYFTAVAEHRNFTRAAAELHLAQPSLSRQIQRLEHRLGVRLLDRTPQGALLTEAGKAFLPEAQALLRAARQAALTARAYAPGGKVIIGYVEDLVVTPAVRELRRRHPDADIVTRFLECHEEGLVTDGHVDVLVARAPLFIPTDNVRVTALYDEPRMLVMAADHPLAQRTSVSLDDFAQGQSVICSHGGTRAIFPAGSRQPTSPEPMPAGPVVERFEDRLELVASGQAVAVLPVGDRRSSVRPDLATVPLDGFPASSVVVASRIGETNPLVSEFISTAMALLVG